MTIFRFGWIGYFRKKNPFVRVTQFAFGILFLHSRQIAYYLSRMVPFDREDHILDLGCGDGSFASWIAYQTGASVVGIDRLSKRIINAQSLASRYHLPCLYHCISIEEATLPKNLFTKILAIDVLEHVAQPRRLIQTMALLLARDGIMFVSVPKATQKRYFRMFHLNFFNYGEDAHIRKGFNEEEVKQWLLAAGFTNIRSKCIFYFFYQIIWEFLEPMRNSKPDFYRLLVPMFYPFIVLDRIFPIGSSNGLLFVATKS